MRSRARNECLKGINFNYLYSYIHTHAHICQAFKLCSLLSLAIKLNNKYFQQNLYKIFKNFGI